MSKTVKLETKVALSEGFHGARRIRRGETFSAPADLEGNWFKSAGKDQAVQDALSDKSNIANVKPKDVFAWASSATSDEINLAISVEQGSGSPRRGVLKQLQDVLSSRVGQVGGPDPAAKDPHEEDPIQPGNGTTGDVDPLS